MLEVVGARIIAHTRALPSWCGWSMITVSTICRSGFQPRRGAPDTLTCPCRGWKPLLHSSPLFRSYFPDPPQR